MASPKTLVVLIDGADWPLLQPLLDREWLPVFQRLLAHGASATLMSLAPFSAPMLLASAVTGQRAWRHGVVTGEGDGKTIPRPLTATLWDLANAAGCPAIVVGGQATTPVGAFSGVFVAEPFFSGNPGDTVWPAALAEEVEPLRVTRSTLDPGVIRLLCPQLSADVAAQDPLAGHLADAVSHLYSVHNVAASLLETEPWQLGIVHHASLATIRRCFSAVERPETPVAVRTRYAEVIAGACRLFVLLLGQLLASAGEGVRVIVASLRGGPALDPQLMAEYPLRHPGAGCLVASGPGFRTGVRLGAFNVLDLAPTILRSLGLSYPCEVDGRVLDEVFVSPGTITFPAATSAAAAALPEAAALGALACFNLGIDLFEAAHFAAALPYLERAAGLRPESPLFAFWLACCLTQLGRDAEAEKAVEVLLDRAGEPLAQIPARLAVIAGLSRQPKRIADRVSLPVTPGSLPPVAVSALANALMAATRWEEAAGLLRDHLLHQPTNDLWLGLARCYLQQRRYRDAADAARHVLADNPGLALAHLCLARALRGSGQYEESEYALREVHRLAPQWPEARAAIAELQPALAAQLPWRIAPPSLSPMGPTLAPSRTPPLSEVGDSRAAAPALVVPAEGTVIAPAHAEHVKAPASLIYRRVGQAEAARVVALLGDPKLLGGEWQPRVWESSLAPRRLVGAAAWRAAPKEHATSGLASDLPGTAHLAIALLPRFRAEVLALAMVRPLLAEMEDAGLQRVIVSTRESAEWARVFQRAGFTVEHWIDETWAGDPLRLRERLQRYDEIAPSWHERGWRLRPLQAEDWALVWKWGVERDYLTEEHFSRLRSLHDLDLSRMLFDRHGPAGLLLVTRNHRTAVLEFLVSSPDRPEIWGIATVLLLRWFAGYSSPAPPYDNFVLTKNLRRDARHTLATIPGMRRTGEQHHFLLGR